MQRFQSPIRKEYMEHIEKQKASGLSIKEYCEKNNLIEHKFSYYRSYKPSIDKEKNKFAQIKVKPSTPKPLPSRKNIDPKWLAELIHSLHAQK